MRKKADMKKSKKGLVHEQYIPHLGVAPLFSMNDYDLFVWEQARYRNGDIIPEQFDMNLYNESGFFFGTKSEPNGYIGKPASQDGHILVAGVPGSGKTMGIVIPTLMTWRGSQVILDVKGDLYEYWSLLNRHTGKKVLVFSPERLAKYGDGSCRYDPFALLRQGGENELAGNARDLALALIPLLPTVKDPVWIQAAQNFLTGAIHYYFSLGCTFIETMLTIQTSSVLDILDEIMKDNNTVAKVYISKLREVQEKVLSNIGMELSNLSALVTDPAVIDALSPKEGCALLDWSELNISKEPVDVILEIPEANLERWRPMLLLMMNQLVKSLERRPRRTYKLDGELPPVLVMLDEFPRIGKVSAIQNGLSTLRSRGVTFALFVQSLANLEDIYGSTASRVIADICSYKVVLGVTDAASQKYFSDVVGTTETLQRSFHVNHDPYSGRVAGYSQNLSENREPIIYPHQFSTLENVVLITLDGYFSVKKTLFIERRDWFLKPQLLKNRDYQLQKYAATFEHR